MDGYKKEWRSFRKRVVPCKSPPSKSTVVESEAVKVMIKTMIKGNPFRKKVVLLKDAFILTAVLLKLYSAHGIYSISNKRRSELSPTKRID
jgi:hypothetical protein